MIAGAVGGSVEHAGRHAAKVVGSEIGDIKIYLDTRYAQPARDPTIVDDVLDALELRENAADLLKNVMPVPVEMVTEPLTRAGFAALDRAIEALRLAGAGDTKSGTLYAYGMHLNPEHRGGPRGMSAPHPLVRSLLRGGRDVPGMPHDGSARRGRAGVRDRRGHVHGQEDAT